MTKRDGAHVEGTLFTRFVSYLKHTLP